MNEEPVALDQVTPAMFEAAIGSLFRCDDEPPFTLTEVRRYTAGGQPREEPFALYFTRAGEVRAQGIVRLEHDDIGVLEIFIVPISAAADVVTYEAVFN